MYKFVSALLSSCTLLTSLQSLASEHVLGVGRVESEARENSPFKGNYLHLWLSENYPRGYTQDILAPAYPHPAVSYMHAVTPEWVMGFSGQFKIFDLRATRDQLAILSVSHDLYRVIRLSHPFYLLLGEKIFYMLPTQGAVFPLQKVTGYETDIGIALSAMLTHYSSFGLLTSFRLEVWRGTRTKNFQGFDVAFGLGSDI